MAKIADVNEKIARTVTKGYKKIEDGVVNGYKKIENGAVEGFGKVSDAFVEKLFAKEGESVEDAKKRLGGAIGIVGMVLAIANYPLYNRILSSRRRKYADEVIALSDELMK